MNAELENIWSRVQSELAQAVDEASYRIWLEPLTARDLAHGRLSIEVSPTACGWVASRYGRLLQVCVERVLGERITIDLLSSGPSISREDAGAFAGVAHERPTARLGSTSISAEDRRAAVIPGTGAHPATSAALGAIDNPKLTFDQFVIGDCNRLAHAAALAVAELPGHAYNPLYICGPPGVGKTHLLGSIATLLRAHNPGLTIHSTTGEAFTNDFLGSLSTRQTGVFKARHRDIDVLLLDDVQFLQSKARTEEEFFHTFNALYDSGRQIVLTSDRPPRDLQALEDRLRERFASGLIADIAPPDYATRMTILRKRAHHDRLALDSDAPLELIAERVVDNVRAIESALIRVVAFSSLTGRHLDLELTREVLDGLYPLGSELGSPQTGFNARPLCGPPSIEEIVNATSTHYGLSPEELISASRSPRIAWPRQVAMYLARQLTDHSLPTIGRQLGGRDHTTVLHACRRTAARIASEDSARDAVDELLRALTPSTHSPPPQQPDRVT